MKKQLLLTTIMMALTLGLMAQDNKPQAGAFGIGFGLGLSPISENVSFTYMVTNNIEVGGWLSVAFSKSSNSTFDSSTALGPNTVTQTQNQTTTTSVGITPMFKYHFNVSSNLDVYTGVYIPISITPDNKYVNTETATATNIEDQSITTTTGPITTGIGVMIPIGCQWFFVKHLAVGLEAGLGFNASFASGNDKTSTTDNTSGSANPAGTTTSTTNEYTRVKSSANSLNLLDEFGIGFTWYFGGGGK